MCCTQLTFWAKPWDHFVYFVGQHILTGVTEVVTGITDGLRGLQVNQEDDRGVGEKSGLIPASTRGLGKLKQMVSHRPIDMQKVVQFCSPYM